MKTSIETRVVYQLAVLAWCSVKKPLFIASLCLVHFMLSDRICSVQSWVLDPLYLNNVVTTRLLELILHSLVFLCICGRIKLIEMHSFFFTVLIVRLGSPVFWKEDTCRGKVVCYYVRKPVNANPGLKVDQGFCFFCLKACHCLFSSDSLKATKIKLQNENN